MQKIIISDNFVYKKYLFPKSHLFWHITSPGNGLWPCVCIFFQTWVLCELSYFHSYCLVLFDRTNTSFYHIPIVKMKRICRIFLLPCVYNHYSLLCTTSMVLDYFYRMFLYWLGLTTKPIFISLIHCLPLSSLVNRMFESVRALTTEIPKFPTQKQNTT